MSVFTDTSTEPEVQIELELATLFALAGGALALREALEQEKVLLRGQPALVTQLRGEAGE